MQHAQFTINVLLLTAILLARMSRQCFSSGQIDPCAGRAFEVKPEAALAQGAVPYLTIVH